MRRLAAIDWLLIGTLLPLWLFGIVMTVVHGVRGDFVRVPFLVAGGADAQSYPTVTQVFPAPGPAAGALAVGDRLVQVEGSDLRGVCGAEYSVRRHAAVQKTHTPLFTIERDGVRSDIRVPVVPGVRVPGCPWWAPLPFVFGVVGTVLFTLVRATHWHLARRFYVVGLLWGLFFTPYFGPEVAPRLWQVNLVVLQPLALGLTLWTFFDFAPGLHLWGKRARVTAWTLSLLTAAAAFLPNAGLPALLMRSQGLVTAGCILALLVASTQTYARSGALERRQLKWIVYGGYVGLLPVAVNIAAGYLFPLPEAGVREAVVMIAMAAVPLGFLVAIAFYQFVDIDRLFSATLAYSALAIVALAVAFVAMPAVSRAASDVLGLDPANGQLFLAVGVAALLVPSQRLLRPRIDALLFPERLTLHQGFEHLLEHISSTADVEELTRLVGERLDALLKPSSAVSYALGGDVFTPLIVRGRTPPPAFAAQSALVMALRERTTPLAADRWTQRRSASLVPFERAALETLDVAVVMPIRRGADLVAFSCLGPKRSGDIYTPTDLALLGAVAGKISDRLVALATNAVVQQAQAMQEALRRYVPGAVAERIVSGRDLDAGEREVTVLFVDIRGYTGLSEPREAEEIFHTVDRSAKTVSQLVAARGGVVVEFTGDGMMAVFGAPEELAMKEREAVQAARDILAAMAGLAAPGGHPGATLSVGVGIATGPAFVGNVRSADRFIWTVIGNTVNLAARLQALTRELDAAVALDDTTFRRARLACADFLRHADLAIRGRAEPETVHALPLRS